MKAVNIINLILIVLLLAGICVAEEVVVTTSLNDIQDRCLEIVKLVESEDSLKNMETVLKVDNLEYYWNEHESKLCFMVHHKNIQEMGQEIAKVKMYVANDDVKAFKVSIETILLYCHGYLHFMGANLHNIL